MQIARNIVYSNGRRKIFNHGIIPGRNHQIGECECVRIVLLYSLDNQQAFCTILASQECLHSQDFPSFLQVKIYFFYTWGQYMV